MAIRKTEDEKQAERQAMERARLAREAEQARAKYLTSPLGQAETAYQAEQAFFQLTVNISEVQGRASDWNYSQTTQTRRFSSSDLLGQVALIEDAWVGRIARIGRSAVVEFTHRTERCVMINNAQDGLVHSRQALRAVAEENDLMLGIYAKVIRPGTVRLGDEMLLMDG